MVRLLILATVSLFLASCGSNNRDDLDQFISNAAQDMSVKIEPLPEVKPYVSFEYNADGALNNPFKSRKAQSTGGGGIQPNLGRPKEPLEAFPLESLKYVGLLSKEKLQYALIKTPDNNVQQIKIGNYLGQNFGMVADITENEVVVKEIIQDDLSGDWVERTSRINLQE
ncbi:pilus assembly protein PilP [Methylovorus sp. MM2]|uniref:pilus assembly protein PilP n=1 Tax=Methylovorus sp. MM2 TaxID=1848038 RepID=UPI0007DE843F|nr:pilus assembly protein PilP [Methylovorus sp. MM2]OAM53271.1 pilus assembly protein PilP [Methylovorus sp. MM2]